MKITENTIRTTQFKNTGENIMNNYVLTKEKYLISINNFKKIFNDKALRPKIIKKEYPQFNYTSVYKEPGLLNFTHFLFYRMLKQKDFKKATHSTQSEKFKSCLIEFKSFIKDSKPETKKLYIELNTVFSDLTVNEIKDIISKALETY